MLLSMECPHILHNSVQSCKLNSSVNCSYCILCVDGFGAWDSRNCRVLRETAEEVDCGCDHLTHFAILLVRTSSQGRHIYTYTILQAFPDYMYAYIPCECSLLGSMPNVYCCTIRTMAKRSRCTSPITTYL